MSGRRGQGKAALCALAASALFFAVGQATAAKPAASIDPALLPSGTVGAAYAQQLSLSGSSGRWTMEVTQGALPSGLSLSSSGSLSGTPSAAGTFAFTVSAFSSNKTVAATRAYSITVVAASSPSPATISPSSLPAGSVGVPYSQQVSVSGSAGPYTVRVTQGALPSGLSLLSSGSLSGTPPAAGTFAFTVSAFSSSGAHAASRDYSIAVAGAPAPSPAPYFSDDFEGGLGKWNREGPLSAFATAAGWSGQSAVITAGPSTTGPTSGSSEMASLWLNWPTAHGTSGESTWYAAKVMFPSTYRATTGQWNWFMEWHVDDYTSAYPGTYSSALGVFTDYPVTSSPGVNPRIAFRVTGGSVSAPQSYVFAMPSNSLRLGYWYDVLVHFVWSPSASTGRAELWLDGQQLVGISFPTLYTLPNGSTSFHYFGLYNYRLKASWDASIYFDRVRIGPTLSSVQ